MTCAEVEILLADYVDGTLHVEERTALELHLAGCAACTQLAADVQGAAIFIERVSEVEPPPELMTRILHHAPIGRRTAEDPVEASDSWIKRLIGRFTQTVLQPRYVMGMAMTILSFSMLARFAHIEPRQLRASDLDPVKVWQGIDDRSHRIYDRSMKYYDNLKLVIEVQSRLREWTDADTAGAGGAPANRQAGVNERGNR
ncbi:MAG TPA: zf-HC2 domain-containing protein [Bryobacteraceae bacterium]|nr:zf-HC2 domain-containing protein [Bryobacteraceae bacterium]